jgi:DNA polymerase I
MATAPVLIVDTYSLFFRAYHALPPMSTASGEPTSALYGFSSVLLKELREQRPSALAFAVDAPKRTFRHERYAAYKGTRDAVPSPLVAQLGRLPDLLAAFDVPVFCCPGFEADDVLATLAHRLREQGRPVLVLTGDRDLLQLAHGGVEVMFVGARGQKPVRYDAAKVEERFEVSPEQLPAWIALVGDNSDNLPGVPGVGPRTAAKWVRQYGSVPALLEQLGDVQPARLAPEIAARREQLLLNAELTVLRVDAPIGDGALAAALSSAALGKLRELFTALEFKSLLARLELLASNTPDPGAGD